ncbi:unnamed protein product [Tilletia caries]|uniref:Uncharacterized protein n=1 Tax=Tilletia caries TaxID=13290 RepID=A0ABN7J2U1_9BASI|nr:unnamed protein product [Tilletia caries]
MAPRKRKDPEDNVPSGSGNPDFGSLAQGQGQVQFQGNDTSDGHPDLEENEQPFNDPDIERLSPDPNRQRDASDNGTQGNPAQHNRPSAIDIQDMTLEELELELEIKTLRKAILQKKKRFNRTPTPQETAPFDTESVLPERQNERLRRAGLLPPRDTTPRSARPSAPVPSFRHQSVPNSVIMHGLDKKIPTS